ncbi:MAG: hypothetical protein CR976_00040 [Thiotrichales bacterium]|nr:MAG: hypothetical protein CR976_00040 [Thiotrichales bacterium]
MEQTLENLDEASLIRQCQAELPYVMSAFSELVRRHERYVFNVCQRYLGSMDDAEDITQEVFMRVFHVLPGFEGRSQFRTWLYRIVTNECHALAGKRKYFVQMDTSDGEEECVLENFASDQASPEEELLAKDEQDCVQYSLQKMRQQEVEILNLRFMGALSLEEIAVTLGTKLSATKMRFYRAMEQFKKIYEKLCM